MTKLDQTLFNKVEKVASTVLQDLRAKGYIVPTKLDNNRVSFEGYIVGRDKNGFYYIEHNTRFLNLKNINLAQSAILIANCLALGRIKYDQIIEDDMIYGYRTFDQEVFKRGMEKSKADADRYAFYRTRFLDAKLKAAQRQDRIKNSFEKLTSLR